MLSSGLSPDYQTTFIYFQWILIDSQWIYHLFPENFHLFPVDFRCCQRICTAFQLIFSWFSLMTKTLSLIPSGFFTYLHRIFNDSSVISMINGYQLIFSYPWFSDNFHLFPDDFHCFTVDFRCCLPENLQQFFWISPWSPDTFHCLLVDFYYFLMNCLLFTRDFPLIP